MKMTLKKEINIGSLSLHHNILIQATMLLEGREGVLETEKLLYLMIAFVDNMVEENLIEECNEDEKDLMKIVEEDIEPFFYKLLEDKDYEDVWYHLSEILLKRCQEIWNNQHSAMGVIDAMLTALANIPEDTQKEALVETAKIAEKAFERRTEEMKDKTEKVNDKLQELIEQYKRVKTEDKEEKIEEENDI